jgi:hypothetical protein
MKNHAIACLLLAVMSCSHNCFGRGAVPPPPAFAGLGNAGDWLPPGSLFGFENPIGGGSGYGMMGWGWGGESGNGSGNTGDGFEWNRSGGGGPYNRGTGRVGVCSCAGGRCNRVNEAKCRAKASDVCDHLCACAFRAYPNIPKGSVVSGWCQLGRVRTGPGCQNPGDVCTGVRYGN